MKKIFNIILLLFLTGCDSDTIVINNTKIKTEYAKSFKQQENGLMFRKELCKNCGMLFVFNEGDISMWMKNTFIPLDMIFANKDGKIICIKKAFPHDLTPITCANNIKYVLETNQYFTDENNIKIGDYIKL